MVRLLGMSVCLLTKRVLVCDLTGSKKLDATIKIGCQMSSKNHSVCINFGVEVEDQPIIVLPVYIVSRDS